MSAVSARPVSRTLCVGQVHALQRVLYRCAKQDREHQFHALVYQVARSDRAREAGSADCVCQPVNDVGEPCAGGSSRQGCDPAGASPATSVVHVGREATPHPGPGNRPGDAWCERPGGPARQRCGRSSLEAERVQEPEGDRMTAATKYGSPRKLPCGDRSARRTRFPWGEAGVLGEGMDKCSRGARRGMGPSTCTRVAEIMSGRAIAQQGLATTCKDPARKARAEARGGWWSGA